MNLKMPHSACEKDHEAAKGGRLIAPRPRGGRVLGTHSHGEWDRIQSCQRWCGRGAGGRNSSFSFLI